jgi:hypothetical protein
VLQACDPELQVRHLDRWRGVSYPATCRRVAALYAAPELRGTPLVVDATGVGRAVLEALREALPAVNVIGVTATAGVSVSSRGWGRFGVPKLDLIDAARVLLEQGRLKIAEGMPLAGVLVQELIDYRVKITKAAHETFGAAAGTHDDLLFAMALGAWFLTSTQQPYTELVLYPSAERPDRPADKWSALSDLGIDLADDWEDRGWR